jgi:hypothetical protein
VLPKENTASSVAKKTPAFNGVPREVVWWALRCLGIEEWQVTVIMAMYENVTTTIKTRDKESDSFEVKVGVH